MVFEHNPRNPVTRWMVRKSPVDADALLLPRSELEALAADAGLELIHAGYLAFFPPPLAFLSTSERWLGWCPAGGQYVLTLRRTSSNGTGAAAP